jgi:hypothetical protein
MRHLGFHGNSFLWMLSIYSLISSTYLITLYSTPVPADPDRSRRSMRDYLSNKQTKKTKINVHLTFLASIDDHYKMTTYVFIFLIHRSPRSDPTWCPVHCLSDSINGTHGKMYFIPKHGLNDTVKNRHQYLTINNKISQDVF